jgi:hypothetical protein
VKISKKLKELFKKYDDRISNILEYEAYDDVNIAFEILNIIAKCGGKDGILTFAGDINCVDEKIIDKYYFKKFIDWLNSKRLRKEKEEELNKLLKYIEGYVNFNNLEDALKVYGDAKTLLANESYKNNKKIVFEILDKIIECGFRNFKYDRARKSIRCLKDDYLKRPDDHKEFFTYIINELIPTLNSEELLKLLEFDEKIIEKGLEEHSYDSKSYLILRGDVYSIHKNYEQFIKAIKKFGVKKFKKLFLKRAEFNELLSLYSICLNACGMDLEILKKYYEKIKKSYNFEILNDIYKFEYIGEAYKLGYIDNNFIEKLIIAILKKKNLKELLKNKKVLEWFEEFLEIVCNDENFENYWVNIQKLIERLDIDIINKNNLMCYDITRIFEI